MTEDARRLRQLRKADLAIRALVECGNPKSAAIQLGLAEDTLRRHVCDYLAIYGFDSVAQAAYWLDRPHKSSEKPQGRVTASS